jgi:8-oxo-dGTP pyrophosphatase MutT (NUDIX family)
MDSSRLSELKRTVKKVVREAQRPGGSLDKNEFTMGVARRLISEKMGLGDDGLDESKWKKIVKEHVMHYLVRPDLVELI